MVHRQERMRGTSRVAMPSITSQPRTAGSMRMARHTSWTMSGHASAAADHRRQKVTTPVSGIFPASRLPAAVTVSAKAT